jgi:hypothetical protein
LLKLSEAKIFFLSDRQPFGGVIFKNHTRDMIPGRPIHDKRAIREENPDLIVVPDASGWIWAWAVILGMSTFVQRRLEIILIPAGPRGSRRLPGRRGHWRRTSPDGDLCKVICTSHAAENLWRPFGPDDDGH